MMSKTTSPSKSDRIEKVAFATRRPWNPCCRRVDSEWKRNRNEPTEKVRQLLNCELDKNLRDLGDPHGAFWKDSVGGNQAARMARLNQNGFGRVTPHSADAAS
jgi:hypothetical protein